MIDIDEISTPQATAVANALLNSPEAISIVDVEALVAAIVTDIWAHRADLDAEISSGESCLTSAKKLILNTVFKE